MAQFLLNVITLCHILTDFQNVTATLDNNWDNKHVVSCCYCLKMCCYRSRLVFNCCL